MQYVYTLYKFEADKLIEKKVVFECNATDIMEADKMFEAAQGYKPAKLWNLTCWSPDWQKNGVLV